MPSLQDSVVLFILALLLFGPKKLPVLARELGKWVGEFRRASNEFKMQMEEELRISETAEREKTIAAMEAAAPVAPVIEDPEHPHLPAFTEPDVTGTSYDVGDDPPAPSHHDYHLGETPTQTAALPIATSGDISIMPPATGLPTPRSQGTPFGNLLGSIPVVEPTAVAETAEAKESSEISHG